MRACQANVADGQVLLSHDLKRSFPLFEKGMLCLLRVYSRYANLPMKRGPCLLNLGQSLPRCEQLHSRRLIQDQ